MPNRSDAIAAAVRAVRGESDLAVVMPALGDPSLARVIACAPETHPLVRAVAALRGDLHHLLDSPTRADPALHGAMARLIGTRAGRETLRAWVEVAPAGWGRAHAAALIDAVQQGVCDSAVAAALIGPGDESAALLAWSRDAAFAIRCWGRSDAAAPIAWATALAPAERDRLIATVRRDPLEGASCLPWLPPDVAWAASETCYASVALDAFAVASPTARMQGAAIVQRLVARSQTCDLGALTRLACAMPIDEVWSRVQALIRASPDDVWRVAAAAPWNDLAKDVRAAILECADESDGCAAVAAARGQGDPATMVITYGTTVAFFAALDPRVWEAFDAATQQRWGQAALSGHIPLAVRSLGLRPEILARAPLTGELVRAVHRHARGDAATMRQALFPITLRAVDSDAAHAVIAAMPSPPPDPGAFFIIACGRADPDVLALARSALRTPGDLACAVALQRGASRDERAQPACTALTDALRGRTWDDLAPLLTLLTDAARTACTPSPARFARRLARLDRREALRRTLDRLAALPPEVAIPTHVALHRRTKRRTDAFDAAAALADALQAYGDLFLKIADALANDDLRQALLPLPEDAALADALRGLAQDDPPTARRLAHALRTSSWRDALQALLHAPPAHAAAVWHALNDDARQVIGAVVAAAPPDAVLSAVHDPIAALALAALHADDADLRTAGVAALTARPAFARAIWGDLPPEMRQLLGKMPACADLSEQRETRAIWRGPRR